MSGLCSSKKSPKAGSETWRPRIGSHTTSEPVFDFPRAERYGVPQQTAELINQRRASGGRIVVCGTSVLRTLETVATEDGRVQVGQGFTRLIIIPGHRFRACDAFLTNLHRPKSSEILLTSAFAGREPLLTAYQRELIPQGYLFYEFDDSTTRCCG